MKFFKSLFGKPETSPEQTRLESYCASLLQESDFGYEERLQNLYQNILKKGDVAVDVGAHSGRHAIPMAAAVGVKGTVIAFEVLPGVFPVLKSKCHEFALSNVEIKEVALSSAPGTGSFTVAVDRPEESGLLRREIYNGATELKEIRISIQTLDHYDLDKLRFLKIDTEGAEFDVLKGAERTLRKNKPVIAFEFGESSYKSYGVNPTEVFEYLEGMGFVVLSILGETLSKDGFHRASIEQTVLGLRCLREKGTAQGAAHSDVLYAGHGTDDDLRPGQQFRTSFANGT